MQKILFTDLDGTLLDDNKNIHPANTAAIENALKAGHLVVAATGRSLSSALFAMENLHLNKAGCYAITYNGGIIYDCGAKKPIFKKSIPLEWAKYIFEEAEKFDIHCQTYTDGKVITRKQTPELEQYKEATRMEAIVDPDLFSHLKEEPVKLLTSCLTGREKHEAYRRHMEDWAKGKMSLFFSGEYYLEHVMDGISKGNAIKMLCDYLQIPIENTIAAGDAENDLTMLNAAHIGVCMKNGTDEVKQAADYITELTNNEGAIAEVISKFLL